ncbi:MAG TPA: hypothetical protein VMZ53_01220 [Kofleriaceae bacterium]|nr:hypothetical protein [Kofleriaceae bacterium]
MIRLFVGLLKGAVIGGAVGYGAHALAEATGFSNAWLTYGVVGMLVGLFVGKPLWTLLRDPNTTNIVAIIKAVFGFGVGCGLYALFAKAWAPDPKALMIADYSIYWPPILGGAIGAVYGGFVELDDSIGDDRSAKSAKSESGPVKKLPAKK